MLEEHQKSIANLRVEKDDAQNEHSKVVVNGLSKSKSHIPPKSRKRESSITIATNMEEEVDPYKVIPFNMSFSKCLVEP